MSSPLWFKRLPHDPDPLGVSPIGVVGWEEYIRRMGDVGLSMVILTALFPIFLFIAILIKLDSPGPVIFTQVRVGRRGKTFRLYKFRSMYVDAEQRRQSLLALNDASGPLFKMKCDPRVTRAGRFLRRSSLDEFPQLINVFRGEMTLVGPRPALPGEVATYGKVEARRLLVKPGLTGLWQISGRADLPYEEAIRLDLAYVTRRSILLDFLIILKTIPAVIGGRGAY
jgi:lipopolysaccharide/colanic/teichoic acid biosynthesis glycosyltransferase